MKTSYNCQNCGGGFKKSEINFIEEKDCDLCIYCHPFENNTMKTKVIFKIATFPPFEADEQPIKELIALFPEIPENNNCILSYAHIGQHSQAHKDFLNSPNAHFNKYIDLYFELTNSVGYDLEVFNPDFDLFQCQNLLPDEVQTIIGKFEKSENSYEDCQNLVRALNGVGYTCDFDLDAVPFGLRKLSIGELEKITAAECKRITEADRNKIANECLIDEEEKTQHLKIQTFCTEYRDKNEYNPKFLDEYNAKFNAEFKEFLNSGNFSQKIIELYTN